MKKILAALLVFTFLVALINNGSTVSAYPGGLLQGKVINGGSNANQINSTHTQWTDGNESTAYLLDSSTRKMGWYAFSQLVTINSIKLRSDDNLEIIFYDQSNSPIFTHNYIRATTGFLTVTIDLTTPVSNVAKVSFRNSRTSGNMTLVEFDVFGHLTPDTTAPGVPTGLQGIPGNAEADLNWTANTAPDLASYNIYKDNVFLATVTAPATTYKAVALTNGAAYSFTVTAVDGSGNESAKSSAVQVIPQAPDTTAPAIPAGLQGIPGNTEVNLSWTANIESDVTSYKIYKDNVYVATVAAPITTYKAVGLTNGVTYSFTVTAVDGNSNESAKSSAVQVTPEEPYVGRGILTITLINGMEKEYDLSMTDINNFIEWYDLKAAGTGSERYKFVKTWNNGPFKSRVEYVLFGKILTFEVDEYDIATP
ncbi:fibronectin type III domain-containing protein [Paenibacillus sp. GCM10027627]|uniref:fibronectin type III domain-containing protein n=1 Tax=unclassified Paenibacillus TaxID=185978 RepID=UPI00362DA8F7